MTRTPRELVFTAPVYRVRKGRRDVLSESPAPPPPPRARPRRVARLIALAHVLQARVEAGESAADVSRALGFSRARVSQLLALTPLAPVIHAKLLFMTNDAGYDWITEHALRGVVAHLCSADRSAPRSTTSFAPTTSDDPNRRCEPSDHSNTVGHAVVPFFNCAGSRHVTGLGLLGDRIAAD